MAARDYDTDVDDPLAIDVVQGTNENENELETSRGSKKPHSVEACTNSALPPELQRRLRHQVGLHTRQQQRHRSPTDEREGSLVP